MFSQDLSDVFSAQGPLAENSPHYTPRQAQMELAQAIEQAIHDNTVLIAEAGTGTGKTWAYLVPIFLRGGKTLISTGTRTLQDQLFRRDIPQLRKMLAVPIQLALLKGRGNYVCHYYLDRLEYDEAALSSRTEVQYLREIQLFAQRSRSGDKSELATVPEEAEIWQRVTSTRENCLGQDCPFVRECFVMKARRQAQEADVVVVNHALFMADLALREDGITDLLPAVDLVVFDEAHQLPDVATRFLGTSISLYEITDLSRQVEVAGLGHARDTVNWSQIAAKVQQAGRELHLSTAPAIQQGLSRVGYFDIPEAQQFDERLEALLEVLDKLLQISGMVAERHPDLAAAHKLALDIRARLFQWSQPDRQGRHAYLSDDSNDQEHPEQAVRWLEIGRNFLRLHSAPLSVAGVFSRYRAQDQSWVLTSATLTVHGDFSHFQRQLGLQSARTQVWSSPFDYAQQGLFYVPSSLPLPSHPSFNEAFVDALFPLLKENHGGALVLCTTLRAVERLADLLAEHFEAQGIERTVLRQGQRSRQVLLDEFRARKNAVLVGSASFWEGIDLPGESLTLVAIDKLPFAPPDDPVLEARINECKARGGNPFMEYQIPEAAIALKQGAGRLIRTERDWGVLLVGDTRLVDKPYGKVLWRGLPPFSRTRDPARALAFLREKKSQHKILPVELEE
ncbi:ATP-dependent DNA helicase [Alcaligenes endophyticus]|uniref:DNA 5'-3' helicase n=1 Tax=Alcaligenes endophyticus TaxID=1929088 RepID=A0ABT8EN82_9BURK|nr:ATP-dependent DNA helicase [Alcaligenes endophyticus]MCX5591358.1 ATP-dependent DNA helicase [Alcaligenes endophyticus]MDN4122761.1 ATP-dependent DNA helicase [Alcaligenes endophyticus]